MSRALLLIVVLCQPLATPSQSLIEETVTGLLGRTAKMGRSFADIARGQQPSSSGGLFQGFLDPPSRKSAAGIILRPQDGTVVGGLLKGFMKDVDDNGKTNTASFLHPDNHQVVGAFIGGLANGRATTPAPMPTPEPEEEVLGLIESLSRRRKEHSNPATTSRSAPVMSSSTSAPVTLPAKSVAPQPGPAMTAAVADVLNVDPAVPAVLDDFRRDVQRDAPECSQKAKAQLSKVLGNFRKGVLDCVGVEDADLGDVLNRLRQVLLTADRLPTSLAHNLRRCSAYAAAARNTSSTSSAITRIPPPGQASSGEVSAARCILQALADARDRLHKIPGETAAFSRRVAFLLAGSKTDARVRACIASQLTSMAHPIVATARQVLVHMAVKHKPLLLDAWKFAVHITTSYLCKPPLIFLGWFYQGWQRFLIGSCDYMEYLLNASQAWRKENLETQEENASFIRERLSPVTPQRIIKKFSISSW